MHIVGPNGQPYHSPDEPLSAREMSSQQRSALLDAMAAQVDKLTQQVAALTEQGNALVAAHNGVERSIHDVSTATAQMFYGRTFWQRVRWLVTGR